MKTFSIGLCLRVLTTMCNGRLASVWPTSWRKRTFFDDFSFFEEQKIQRCAKKSTPVGDFDFLTTFLRNYIFSKMYRGLEMYRGDRVKMYRAQKMYRGDRNLDRNIFVLKSEEIGDG